MSESILAKMAEACPSWSTATLLLRDDRGAIVGYGWINRETGRVVVSAEGARLLGESHVGCEPIPPA